LMVAEVHFGSHPIMSSPEVRRKRNPGPHFF
jgi:hypothetical protein